MYLDTLRMRDMSNKSNDGHNCKGSCVACALNHIG